MTTLTVHAAWVLLVAFGMSFAYELWRATAKAETSRHDTTQNFLQGIPLYVVAGAVVAGLVAGWSWATWVGLVLAVGMIGVSIFYYNPVVLPERHPGLVDWVEDLVFTGLLFVAATLLLYEVVGKALV